MAETLPAHRDTAHGRRYGPLGELTQGGVLFLALFSTLGMGWSIGRVFGGLSEAGEIGVRLPFVLAGGAFAWGGWCMSVSAALLARLIDAEVGLYGRAGTMGFACGLYGQGLAWLARRGYLPMMESE